MVSWWRVVNPWPSVENSPDLLFQTDEGEICAHSVACFLGAEPVRFLVCRGHETITEHEDRRDVLQAKPRRTGQDVVAQVITHTFRIGRPLVHRRIIVPVRRPSRHFPSFTSHLMSTSAKLSEVLTLAEVQSLADTKTFARGKAYFHDGVVSHLDERDEAVRATVRGTHRYRVELAVDNGELAYDCNCPIGDDGVFCKHTVAVALSWLENTGEEVFHAEEPAPGKPRKKRKTYEEVIREYVATLGRDALQELLMGAVEQDLALRDKLLFAARAAGASDLPGMKAAVKQATRISRPLDWRESGAYGDGLMSLADMLRQRLSRTSRRTGGRAMRAGDCRCGKDSRTD